MTFDNRGGRRRTWIKLNCQGIVHGSINYQLSDAEQMVWVKLLAYAGIIGREGQISDNDGRPLPHPFIAQELHIGEELLEHTLIKCSEEGRISEDEHGLHITNWKTYQSEYERQKPYRDRAKGKLRGIKGIKYLLRCPECHYCIELSKATKGYKICPQCNKKGKDTPLKKIDNPEYEGDD